MATKNKIIKTGIRGRNELIKGADFLADAVKTTLGPFGQNFFLEKGNKVTNDGKTIASEMEHPREVPNRGLIALREAALKTDSETGDGTTSALVLAQAIIHEAVKQLQDEKTFVGKMTPAELIRQIEDERIHIVEELKAMATPVDTKGALIDSARVSVEDPYLAELIGTTQFELGPEGVILAEETIEQESSIERFKGIQIDNGFGTSYSINNQEKQTLELDNILVLMTNHTFQNLEPLKKFGDQVVKTGARGMVLIARAFTSEAIKGCIENTRAGFAIHPMNAPYTDQNEIMRDLASVLGGRYIEVEESGLDSLMISDLGMATKIVSQRYSAVLTGGDDEKSLERVNARIMEIEEKLKGTISDFQRKEYKRRLAQLKNGFAILKIGATSDKERTYKKDKADDAVNAVRAAFQEGTVPGAGIAFKTISDGLPDTYILKRPIRAIYEQIMASAPTDFKIEEWVRDPVKVLRIALEKACSVAGSLATATGVITMAKDKPMWVQQVPTTEEDDEEEQVEV